MKEQKLKQKGSLSRTELIILIVSAVVTITVVSTCSPLFPFNPWDDANCFFTLGRGIIHGKVPYRDLYEQKGPLLYFLYALAALISEKSFTGAWIIECVMASLFAIFSWKTAKLFTDPPLYAISLVPLLLGLTYTVRVFNFGGNAEELCFPLLTISLYFGLKAIAKGDGLPGNGEAFICGIMAAALFWIKYTFMGFMAGFCLYILVMALMQKKFAKLWSLVWRFIAGFAALSVPILIYFLANGALNSLWEAYFYNNIFLYHSTMPLGGIKDLPVIRNIYIALYCTIAISRSYPEFGIMFLLSVASLFSFGKKIYRKVWFLYFITLAATLLTVFTKATFIYYYVYIIAYSFGIILIPFIKGLEYISKKMKERSQLIKIVVVSFIAVCFALTLLLSKNSYLLLQNKDKVAQFRYAETINQTPDAKILTYDVMDSGFYTAAGLLPSNRFFCFLNIESNYPAILEEQHRLIKEGYFDYIITSYFCEEKWDNYELVREETDEYVDYTGVKALNGFRLYKRK